jgi:hypothetical protein
MILPDGLVKLDRAAVGHEKINIPQLRNLVNEVNYPGAVVR